jgi:hypothetical protein
MLSRYRLQYLAVGIVVTAVALGLVIAGLLGWASLKGYQIDHANERVSATQHQENSAEDAAQKCLGEVDVPSFAQGVKCLAEAINGNREAEYSKYDLKAQQEMAEWAYAMALLTGAGLPIALIGLGVTVAGVFLVLQSLRHSRQALFAEHRP